MQLLVMSVTCLAVDTVVMHGYAGQRQCFAPLDAQRGGDALAKPDFWRPADAGGSGLFFVQRSVHQG